MKDMAYLMSVINGQPLPNDRVEFLKEVRRMFPSSVDMRYYQQMNGLLLLGGLSKLATNYNVCNYYFIIYYLLFIIYYYFK